MMIPEREGKQMNLAVCDNDRDFLKEMEAILKRYPNVEETLVYQKMDLFFEDLKAGMQFDAVLMDIDLGEQKTGLEYAQRLYREYPHLSVIYITGYNDRFAQQILLH